MKINHIFATIAGIAAGAFKLSVESNALDFIVAFGFAFILAIVAMDLGKEFRDRIIRDRQLQYSLKD